MPGEWATLMPIGVLKPYPRNPRHNQQVAKVAGSIKRFGFRQPIVVDEAMVILVGHTRLEAAKALGLTEVPVHVAAGLTAAEARAYRLADNRTAQEAEWKDDLLIGEVRALKDLDFDLHLTGFDADELSKLLGGTDPGSPAPQLGDVAYEVVVSCPTESAQGSLCERLEAEGFKCRLLTL